MKWVQNIKESHDSVERNALQQVEAIDTRGKYFVGCIGSEQSRVSNVVLLLSITRVYF